MGSTIDSRHPTDWDRQREQLSALVDGELSPTERAELERHLATCSECQEELARLQRVRGLLGALPAPSLPRSFALPTGTTRGTSRGTHQSTTPERERAEASALYRASRWVGGIAASLGLALLLGSALMGLLSPGNRGAATTAASSAFGGAPSTHLPYAPTNGTTQPGAIIVQSPAATPSVTLAPTQLPAPSAPETGEGSEPLPLGPLAGAGLLAGGLVVLLAGRAARPRD